MGLLEFFNPLPDQFTEARRLHVLQVGRFADEPAVFFLGLPDFISDDISRREFGDGLHEREAPAAALGEEL
jgi:hypothetical protein